MDSLPENKNKEIGWGFLFFFFLLGVFCLVLFIMFLMALLGIVMVEGKCFIQFSFLKCALISENQNARYIVGVSLKCCFFLCLEIQRLPFS